MARIEESIVINRPVTDVFAYMDDIHREYEWQPAIRAVEQIPPGPQRVGTTRRDDSSFMKKKLVNVYVNRMYEPNQRVVYESTKESNLQATGDITFASVPGGTRVTMVLVVQPPKIMRLVPKAVFDKASRKELRDSLSRLKLNLES